MPKIFWTYAGRMAFSILGSVAGALVVSHFGLLQLKPEQKLEKIVFDQTAAGGVWIDDLRFE